MSFALSSLCRGGSCVPGNWFLSKQSRPWELEFIVLERTACMGKTCTLIRRRAGALVCNNLRSHCGRIRVPTLLHRKTARHRSALTQQLPQVSASFVAAPRPRSSHRTKQSTSLSLPSIVYPRLLRFVRRLSRGLARMACASGFRGLGVPGVQFGFWV